MSQEIERSEQYLPEAAQHPVDGSLDSRPKGNPLVKLLASARRHWLTVLLAWVSVGAPAAVAVWLVVKPAYTASGFVKVEPSSAIIFQDVSTEDQGGGFDTFLNTQAQEISGSSVLNAALADPSVKDLALTSTVDSLREALTVMVVPRTHLLKVGVKQRDRDAALRLAQAVLRAYESHAGGVDAKKLKTKRDLLESERDKLKVRLDAKRLELYDRGKQFAAVSQTTIDSLRQAIPRSLEEAYREKYRADSEVIQLQGQIDQLKAGLAPTTMPGEEMALKDQMIREDPEVRQLREMLASTAANMARSGRTQALQQLETRTKELLDKALARVSEEADRKIEDRRTQVLKDTELRLNQQLAAAKQRQGFFQKQIEAEQQTGLDMGQNGLEIRKIHDELDSIDRDYKIIDESISKLDIEARRPERITVDDKAEILPGDKDDKRIKLLPVAAVGSLILGLGLAFLRDLISGRLYSGEDVESGVGIRLLGSLPALEDLRRGRISEEDFRESYRSIRATLAGASPNGQIPRTLLITSAQAAEGKTSLAVSLAASLAESGSRVLIIDGDVQAPRIATTLRLKMPLSLRQVLLGECKLLEAVGATPVPSLDALSSGRNGDSAAGLLTQRLAGALIKSAADHYDHVVVDSPPVLGSADALIWAQSVDGVLFSSFAGHSSLSIMRQACMRVAGVGGTILGAVICNLSVRESYYSYSSYASVRPAAGEENAQVQAAGKSGRRPPFVLLPGKESPVDGHDSGASGKA